ncbi:MAG: GIY-YIG nuclease family protein [Verrucomicrobiaceae bacterium]|nr:MAG: GIY-YIG nuclease family protein [Verrucomicrobiaceae bacterium]
MHQEQDSTSSGECLAPGSEHAHERVWHLYVLQCSDGSLYCGIALDVEKRLAQHQSGKGAKYTRARLPVILLQTSAIGPEMAEALRAERRFKALTRAKKLASLKNKPAAVEG